MADVTLDSLEEYLIQIDESIGKKIFEVRDTVSGKGNDIVQGLQLVYKKLDKIFPEGFTFDSLKTNATADTTAVSTLNSILTRNENTIKSIDTNLSSIASQTSTLNTKLGDLITALASYNSHITSNANNVSNQTPSGSAATGSTIIEKGVTDILDELKKIHGTVRGLDNANKYNTGDEELNSKLKDLDKLKIDLQIISAQLQKNVADKEKALYYDDTKDNREAYVKALKEQVEWEKKKEKAKKEADLEYKKGHSKELGKEQRREKREQEREKLKDPLTYINATKDIVTAKSGTELFGKFVSSAANMIGGPIAGAVVDVVKSIFEKGAPRDRASTNYARVIGGNNIAKYNIGETVQSLSRGYTREDISGFRESANNIKEGKGQGWSRSNFLGGYKAEEAFSALTEMAEARGRTIERQTQGAVKSLIDLKRFGIGAEAINNFDTFGKSVEETDKYFAKLYQQVSRKGLSFRTVSKAVNENLKAAQKYSFADGLRSLERMAEKSVQLKYNMGQVFQFAEKVSEVEGAISTAANLSVLGGPYAQFSNPMQLLYEGLNDMEALQKRIEGMFANKAFYNTETKQIDMSAMDKEFVKQAAKGAGLDPEQMLNMAYSKARLDRIESQLGTGLTRETVDYIKNIADLNKNGEGEVVLNGRAVKVSELTEKDREALEQESKMKDRGDNAKLGDVYRLTSNIAERMDNILSFLQEKLGQWVFGLFQVINRREAKRQTIAQGRGDQELKDARLNFYNEHANEFSRFGASSKRGFAEKIAKWDKEQLERNNAQYSAVGNIPVISKPATAGITNGMVKDFGVNNIIQGQSHPNGGVLINAEGGESVLSKAATDFYMKTYPDLLPSIKNGLFNPYSYANNLTNNMQEHLKPISVTPVQAIQPLSPNTVNQAASPSKTVADVNGRIKVDIPETITLNLAGTNIGNIDANKLMPYIQQMMKEILINEKFGSGFDKENFPIRSSVITRV